MYVLQNGNKNSSHLISLLLALVGKKSNNSTISVP